MSISMITQAISNMNRSIACEINGDVFNVEFKRSGNDSHNNK